MRHIVRVLGTRYGAALGLLLIIAAVVGIGKMAGGHGALPDPAVHDPPLVATGSLPPDDGLASPPAPANPSTSPGAAQPQSVAISFTQAWLHHVDVSQANWHAALAPFVTPRLAAELADTDPSAVPATAMTGQPTLVPHAQSYVDVVLPLDAGILDLRLVADQGRWLVDGVDWRRP